MLRFINVFIISSKGSIQVVKIESKSHFKITMIAHVDSHLIFSFNDEWYQEDIGNLYTLLFSLLENLNIQEKIFGADRECVRFSWQNCYQFTLNFDYYSQSCWVEGVDEQSMSQVASLLSAFQINI
jgi:hypothetical protein